LKDKRVMMRYRLFSIMIMVIALALSVRGELTVVLDAADAKALAGSGEGLVHGLLKETQAVSKIKRTLLDDDLSGRVTVSAWAGSGIPFVSETVNTLVVKDKDITDEMRRVLTPLGRIVDGKGKELWRKPWPKEISEWTHYLYEPNNNAVAQDKRIGAPRSTRWLAGPQMLRHHDHLPSLSAMVTSKGRIFSVFDEASDASILFPPKWRLIARDAFNGTVLWKKTIDEWHPHLWPLKSMPATLPRRLVSVGDEVYVTLGITAPVSQLNAVDGSQKRVFAGSDRCEEIIVTDDTVLTLCLTGEGPLDDLVDDARGKQLDPRATKFTLARKLMAGVMSPLWLNADRRLLAYDRDSGKELWRLDGKFAPMSLAAYEGKVYFHDGEAITALNEGNGKKAWTSETVPVWDKFHSWYGASLVIYKDVVLFSGAEEMTTRSTGTPSGARDTMTAFSAKDGKKLWTGEHLASGYRSPEDLFVAQGLVWAPDCTGKSKHILKGVDPHTGEVVREMEVDFRAGFHHRCHAGRATEDYMIAAKVGINLVDFKTGEATKDNWIRGACGYGVMPGNGLIYAAPDPCNCSPEAKINGFAAMAPAGGEESRRGAESAEERLEKGEEYGKNIEYRISNTERRSEWKTYRGDAGRSGVTDVSLPAELKTAWKTELGVTLTAPVIAGGKVYVADIEKHSLMAVDAEDGKLLWTHAAGGRVDSPPTVLGKLLFFGCADGTLTCLETGKGDLVWRRRLAPHDERIVDDGRIESLWPVHGSVLYYNKLIYAAAGRSMHVDGGLTIFSLDPLTGDVVSEKNYDFFKERERGDKLTPRGSDILAAEGKELFMRSMTYDLECRQVDTKTKHLFSPNGFLNGSWFHRAFWTYSANFAGGPGGFGQTGGRNHSGRLMVADNTHLYGFGRTSYGWGSAFEYRLYKAAKPASAEPEVSKQDKRRKKIKPQKKTDWMVDVPTLARAMVKAGERLYVAGPKRLYDESAMVEQLETSEGMAKLASQAEGWENSAELMVVNTSDGTIEKMVPLEYAPVWDGIAVADKMMFVSGKDGYLYCLK
jgi:outer membrane protein assembly factor BamB